MEFNVKIELSDDEIKFLKDIEDDQLDIIYYVLLVC